MSRCGCVAFGLVFLLGVCCFAQEQKEPVLLTTARADYERKVQRLRVDYETRLQREIDREKLEYVKRLKVIKSGLDVQHDTSGAFAVQTEMDSLDPKKMGYTLILWNMHNAGYKDRGTKKFNVELYLGKTAVWRMKNVNLDWYAEKDCKAELKVPGVKFDRVRIEVTEYVNKGGGLSEIQIIAEENNENIARDAKVSASSSLQSEVRPENVIDGVTSSANRLQGYWALANGQPGWIELDLRKEQSKP